MKTALGSGSILLRGGLVAAALGALLGACSSSSSDTGSGNVGGGGPSGGSHSAAGSAGASGSGTSGSVGTAGSAASGTSGASGSGTSGSSGSSSTAGTGPVPTDACPGLPFDTTVDGGMACTGVSVETEAVGVDLLLIMDRSESMGYLIDGTSMTRWDALKAAVQTFVQDPSVGNIGGGIVFFGKSGNRNDTVDCSVDSYSTPDVEITPLSSSGADLVSAIDAITPGGLTPMVPAVQGALVYAKNWAAAHPDRATVAVLVSDGYPTQCNNDPAAVAAATQAGFQGTPSVRSYVIGVGDVAKFNLDNYANVGGTQKAFLTDKTDVSTTFAQALLNITNSKVSCEYQIPPSPDPMMKLDYDKVQVVYTPASGEPQEVPRVDSYINCASVSNGGWYYDNAAMPTKILVCPCSCANFGAGTVEARVGCKPRIGIR